MAGFSILCCFHPSELLRKQMENRADTLLLENKPCGIALKSEGMQVADGLLPFACS